MKKLLSIILAVTFVLSSLSGIMVTASEATEYLSFNSDSSWELEKAPNAMPNTIEAWLKVDGENTTDKISVFGNYGRDLRYIPSVELWLGRKVNAETNEVYYLPRIEYYNVKDWGIENKGKAFYLNSVVINPDEWYHLVVSRDSAKGYIYCYLNNKLVQTVKGTALFEDFVTEDTYAVGGSLATPNNSYFRGDIASIAVYSDNRTADEVSSVYTATVDTKNIAGAIDTTDSSLIASYDLKVVSGTERIKNAKSGGTDLIENMWVEAEDPTDYAYSIAVLGDTQKVAEYDFLKGTNYIDGIYDYVINNTKSKNIKHVLGLGDITDDDRPEEWAMVQNKTNQLDISYSLLRGNHDTPNGFNTYFGEGTKYAQQTAGHYGSNYLNTYHKFTAGDTKYLVVALSWDPSDDVLEWANEVVASHPDHSVIITTHAYVCKDGTTIGEGDTDSTYNNNDGEGIWNKLVKKHSNIVLAIGGHVSSDRIMMSQVIGDNGNTVTQLLINPQGMDEGLTKAGKAPAAMVAMLYFSEDGRNVDIRYYSTSRNTYFKSNNQLSFSKSYNLWQRPYAVSGKAQEPIVMEASKGVFYDDFVVTSSLNFDKFTTVNDNNFQINNAKADAVSNANGVYVSMALTEPDESGNNSNAYGNKGKSIKVNTGLANGVKRLTDKGEVLYNSIRTVSTINCANFQNIDDIAVAFWVKTESAAEFSAAFWDSATNSPQKIYSDPIDIESAGEYIIVIPIGNFYLANASYNKTADISSFKMINLEVMFKAEGIKSGETVDMYFDNIGVYPILPNFGEAKHISSAVIKDNMDSCVDSDTSVKQVTIPDNKGAWTTGNSYATSVRTVDRENGKAICYTAKDYKYSATGFSAKNSFSVNNQNYIIDSLDKNGVALGRDGTLAIWVKASRASRIVVETNNNSSTKWLASEEIIVPAGESIIRIPLSVYYNQDSAFKNIKKIQIHFCCITPQANTIGGATGTFMIDDIAIEPTVIMGDVNGDREGDTRDIVRLKKVMAGISSYQDTPLADVYPDKKLNANDLAVLRGYLLGSIKSIPQELALIEHESYEESKLLNSNWVNKTPATLTLAPTTDIIRHYSGTEDNNTIKINYSNISSSSGNNFYYNTNFVAPFGENSVFCFWVYSEQSVNIRYSYMDYSITDSKLMQCKWVTKTLPKGESIVEIPMRDMVPNGKDMEYRSIYQFQILILSNSNTTNSSGELYMDAFGYYDSSTEFEWIADNKMFDEDTTTYWSPTTTEKIYTGFKTETPVTFNAIDFTEYLDFDEDETNYINNSYVKEFVLDVKQNGKYVELCRIDEIGTRTVVLDDTYTGTDFRITVTAADERFAISKLAFKEISAVKRATPFRNVGYFCASSIDKLRECFYDKLSGYTDIILFDYGSWNANGDFLWGTMYENVDEAHLENTLAEIRALDGGNDLDIWFCLQNYDKSITDTSVLFATETSRRNLAQFAVNLCEKYGFTGIDIDYEYPATVTEWRNYGEFLSLCGQMLHAKGYKLSAALTSFGTNHITANIQSALDYVNMMVYDIYDATGRHSPYSLMDRFYKYYTGIGFRSEQLVLGVPYHTRTLETVDDRHQYGGGGYRGLYDEYAEYINPHTNLITSTSGKWNYYFNGTDMLRDKVWYAISNNMSGVFCWSLRNDVANDNEKGVPSLGQAIIDTIDHFTESIAE